MKNVRVALSGGVDSTAALLLCLKQGYSATGITLRLFKNRFSDDSIRDAGIICRELGVRHIIRDVADRFEQQVIQSFCNTYRRGQTPSPCLHCNPLFKWELMLKEPELDSDVFLATGHYAGISDYRGRPCIRRGLYSDQSYFLHRLTPEHIRRSIFPVGDMQKTQLREMVAAEGLHVANRPDSQEICFIHGKYSDFLNKHLDPVPPPGEIVDGDGTVIGRHKGIHHYTVGQRSGLGIAAPNPLYVVRIDTDTNRLVVGTREDVIRKRFHVENIVWSAVDPPDRPLQCLVQVRYRHIPVSGTVIPRTATSADVVLEDPRGAVVAAGQGAAFYMENNVLGGGEIR